MTAQSLFTATVAAVENLGLKVSGISGFGEDYILVVSRENNEKNQPRIEVDADLVSGEWKINSHLN